MQPKKCYYSGQFSLLSPRLDTIINMQHELVKLTQTIEWEGLEITLQILQHSRLFWSKNPSDGRSTYTKAYIPPV